MLTLDACLKDGLNELKTGLQHIVNTYFQLTIY